MPSPSTIPPALVSQLNVFKFGGTSIGSPDALGRAVAIAKASAKTPLVVVVSAMAGMTDLLLGAASAAKAGDATAVASACQRFADVHLNVIGELVRSEATRASLIQLVRDSEAELQRLCASILVLRETTVRTLDVTVARGERLLAQIFTAVLAAEGVPVSIVDATEIVMVESRFGAVHADLVECSANAAAKIQPLLDAGLVVVVPGYIGRTKESDLVTLGRGGSDFSAAILANALNAAQVTLFKEVDGMMTTDPKYVPAARIVRELHYREAAELAYYGAKILHPRTMIPLAEKRIPLVIKNTFKPDQPGTRIAGHVASGEFPVKALTAVVAQALVSIEGKGMMGVPGVAGRTFAALATANVSVSVITQASSESSICFIVAETDAHEVIKVLEQTFQYEIKSGIIDRVRFETGMAVVAVVGLGMRGTPGIAARTFGSLAKAGANVVAIAQGSSELNISLVVRSIDVKLAVSALHTEFQLDKSSALAQRNDQEINLAVFGFGQIGRKLIEQLLQQDKYIREELKLSWKCVALIDRSGPRVAAGGHSLDTLRELHAQKTAGKTLVTVAPSAARMDSLSQLRNDLWEMPLGRAIFVDTSADETAPILMEALRAGFHVVLANKKPLAIPQNQFDELFEEARRRGLWLRYEATVGAGLPVLDTLAKFREAGDQVITILGSLSGTLGLVTTQMDKGKSFSAAVKEAHAAGYTEPDPREDLSGTDVARKALILARTLDRKLNLEDIHIEPVIPLGDPSESPASFLENVHKHDEAVAARVAEAAKKGMVLRYIARIGEGQVRVGLEEVPKASSLGALSGSENQVVLRTRRYDANPMVVTGPGAGAEVTAAGVLNDIMAIAIGRDKRV